MGEDATKHLVKITESRFEDHRITGYPHIGEPSIVNHQVWVGNDEDGWRAIPRVTNVDVLLRQGEIRKAVITVLLPQIDFEGGRPKYPESQ